MEIERTTGIPAAHVLLAATHTHCGPVTLRHFFNQGQALDETYMDHLAAETVAAAQAAHAGGRPRRVRKGLVPCDGIAFNRRTGDGLPVNPFAGVLLVEEMDGRQAAVAVVYACHTTVLGPDTLSVTQDFPFYTLARLRQQLGEGIEAMFFNGAEGDLSIGNKRDLSAVGIVESFRTFATAQRLGERLGDAALSGLDTLSVEEEGLRVSMTVVELPLKRYAPLAAMTAAREAALTAIDPTAPALGQLQLRQRALFRGSRSTMQSSTWRRSVPSRRRWR